MALETVQVEKNKVKGTKTKVLAAAELDADNTNCKMDECCQKYEQIELNLNEQISAVVGVLSPAAFQEKKLEVESCLSYPTPKESLLPPKESILYVPAEGAAESSSNEDNTNATINSIPPNKSGVPVPEEGAVESSSNTDASATADSNASDAFLDFSQEVIPAWRLHKEEAESRTRCLSYPTPGKSVLPMPKEGIAESSSNND